jgi:predicted TIM-barrel fold metal-dependent hydrolase
VDFHGHFLTDEYVTAARDHGHACPDGMPSWPTWTASRHLTLMDRLGIAETVLSVSSPGVAFGTPSDAVALAEHVNDAAAKICAEHPGRFRFFASLPAMDVAAAVAEWLRVRDAPGIAGVVVLSHVGGIYPGDSRLEPLWSAIAPDRPVVLVHPTSPPALPAAQASADPLGLPSPVVEFMFETMRAILSVASANLACRHRDIRFLFPHAGGALAAVIDRISLFHRADPAGIPDVSETLQHVWFDLAGTPLPSQLPALLHSVNASRFVYGSDYCFTPPVGVGLLLGALDAHGGIDGRLWRDVLADNATHLLDARPKPVSTPAPAGPRAAAAQRLFARAAERLLLR